MYQSLFCTAMLKSLITHRHLFVQQTWLWKWCNLKSLKSNASDMSDLVNGSDGMGWDGLGCRLRMSELALAGKKAHRLSWQQISP